MSAGQVSFYGNGGIGSMEPLVGLSEGQEIQLPRNTFVREGYRFVGWTNTPDSDEPVYQDEYDRYNYYPHNSALYAVWEPIKQTTFLTKLSSKTLLINSAKRIIKYAAVGLQSNVNDPVNREIGEQASGNYLP